MVNTTIDEFVKKKLHLGHPTRDWNPKMAPYIYTKRNGFYIIDLLYTYSYLQRAKSALRSASAQNATFLFVGTKRQASALIKYYAKKCNSFYINHKWSGGLLTNWKTVAGMTRSLITKSEALEQDKNRAQSMNQGFLQQDRTYKNLEGQNLTSRETSFETSSSTSERMYPTDPHQTSTRYKSRGPLDLADVGKKRAPFSMGRQPSSDVRQESTSLSTPSKKEIARLEKQRQKLDKTIGGIRDMKKLPDMVIIIGAAEETNAVRECNKLGIPIVTILDTNCDPTIATWGVPANDDSYASIDTILREFSNAILSGAEERAQKLFA